MTHLYTLREAIELLERAHKAKNGDHSKEGLTIQVEVIIHELGHFPEPDEEELLLEALKHLDEK